MSIQLEELPVLDDDGAAFAQDPYGTLALARSENWLVRSSLGVTVLNYRRALELHRDTRFGQPHKPMLERQGITSGHMYDAVAMAATSKDGADHLRLRRLISAAFTPRRIENHRGTIRATINELIDSVGTIGTTEFVHDISIPFPMSVICRMLGVPDDDRQLFHGWLDQQIKVLQWGGLDQLDRNAWTDMHEYLTGLLISRRAEPRDDLITALLTAEDQGDLLTHDEVIWQVNMLLGAGQDTTRCQLALAVAMFIQHRDQWALLIERPELAASAVEEVLRYVPTLMSLPKIALNDLEWGGVSIPKDTAVFISYPGVNRDPDTFDEPERFDITRAGAAPLTFGHGAHYCLGAMLSRLELTEALSALAGRVSRLEGAGDAVWRPAAGVTGPSRLPVRFVWAD